MGQWVVLAYYHVPDLSGGAYKVCSWKIVNGEVTMQKQYYCRALPFIPYIPTLAKSISDHVVSCGKAPNEREGQGLAC